jgi:hypothetical protein
VTNHFSVAWVAAAITQQPANKTATEASSVTLTATATGYPNKYQWYKGDVALDATFKNPDNSNKYSGFNTPSLTISQLTLEDAGQFTLKIINPLGDITTTAAVLTVDKDLAAPKVVYVTATATSNRVRVAFDKPVTKESAEIAVNYTFNGGITAASAVQTTADLRVVDVITSAPLTPGQIYTLSVSGVHDTRVNSNVIGANSTSFKAYVLTQGALAMDIYAGIDGGSVALLTGDVQYPNAVFTNLTLSSFGFDVGGNYAERYGARIYGWIKPAVGGDYTFYIRSDDASALYISPDADPAHLEPDPIAFEAGCCNGFAEQNPEGTNTRTSAPRALVANQSYYVEALLKEGGGGDYIHVAWRPPGDTTVVGSLPDIAGTFLSANAPAPLAKLTATINATGGITITWTGAGRLQESTDLTTWSDVNGNPASGYTFTPPSGAGARFFKIVE